MLIPHRHCKRVDDTKHGAIHAVSKLTPLTDREAMQLFEKYQKKCRNQANSQVKKTYADRHMPYGHRKGVSAMHAEN
jgi:hypothetical protein